MKYRFEIIYANEYTIKANDFLKKCDLHMEGVGIKEIITFTSSKEDLTIKEIKELLKKAYESCECEILNIEGGSVQ